MFERFPQLKRLERLLSKTQGRSPKKSKSPSASRKKTDSPLAISQDTSHGDLIKTTLLPTVDSASEVNHSTQMPPTNQDGNTPSHTGDQLDFKQSKIAASHQNKEKKVERRRIWTTALRSPREVLRSKSANSKRDKKLEGTPVVPVEQGRANIPKPPIKRVFFRQMQEPLASDGLNVLSEEESDDQEDKRQTLHYPLPTMPLSIMVPVEDLPEYIDPMDLPSMMDKSSRFGSNLAALMECRNRLASSYTLFDDLCTAFRGQENLEQFLRSLIVVGFHTQGRISPPHCDAQQNNENQLNPSPPVSQVNSSVGSSSTTSCAASTTSNESRLMRLTVSTRMKQVEPFTSRSKRGMTADASTDCSAYAGYGGRPAPNRVPSRNGRSPAKRLNKCHHSPPLLSDEESREEMMYRVRRGLLNLPWILRRRSSSFSRIAHDHSIVPPIHG